MAYNYGGGYNKDNDTGFDPMPVGVYEFIIADCTETTSKAGHPIWKMVLQPVLMKYERRKIWHYIILDNEYTEMNIGRILNALGKDTSQSMSIEPHQLCGKIIQAKIKHDKYNGNMYEKIAYFVDQQVENPPEIEPENQHDNEIPF